MGFYVSNVQVLLLLPLILIVGWSLQVAGGLLFMVAEEAWYRLTGR